MRRMLSSSVSKPSTFPATDFVAQSLSGLLSDCLRLTARITPNHLRLAIGDVACVLPNGISTRLITLPMLGRDRNFS